MVITVVYGVLAVICLGYFAGIVIYTQTVGFALFWLLTGLLLCAAGAYCAYRRKHPDRLEMPLMLKSAVFTCVSAGFLILAAAGITIFMDTEEEAPEDLDYLIVLGSKTVGREPSDTLKLRLDAALEYLQENKKTPGDSFRRKRERRGLDRGPGHVPISEKCRGADPPYGDGNTIH